MSFIYKQSGITIFQETSKSKVPLSGFVELNSTDADLSIKESFTILSLLREEKSGDDEFHRWYEITNYKKAEDKIPFVLAEQEQLRADVDFLLILNGGIE